MIVVKVRDREIRIAPTAPVTSGSVGLPVTWTFSEEWEVEGLAKTAVFRGSGTARDVVLTEDTCVVPADVLMISGGPLEIGVRGVQITHDEDTDEDVVTVVIPTIWGRIDRIYDGTIPSEADPSVPEPDWTEQVKSAATEALAVANGVRQDADDGEFDGATFTPSVSAAGVVSWTNDKGKQNPNPVDIRGPAGANGKSAYEIAVDNGFVGTPTEWLASLVGRTGDKGDDGKSAYQSAVDGGYEGTEAEFRAELASIFTSAETATDAAEAAEAAQTAAETAVTHYPKIVNNYWYVWDSSSDVYVNTGVSATGVQGEDGTDGVSPTVTFTTITGGHTMTVTDKDHPSGQSINIMDGSGGSASMTILSYGNSTWNDFATAYNANSIVYCRASSAADPSSGSQTRLAFMAYVNDSTNPTNVEFQYYRSMSSHTDAQQGDQVYIYKLTSAGAWTVTVREAYTKIVAGTNMSSSYANGTLTLNATGGGGGTSDYDDLTDKPSINNVTLSGNKTAAELGLGTYSKPSGGIPKTDLASAVRTSLGKADTALQSAPVTSVNSKTGAVSLSASDVGALPDDTAIPSKTSDLTNDSGFLTSAPVTSVNNKTGAVTLTASDVGAGTYSKPSGGIPQTDLASAVQSKLDNTVVVSDTQPTATENKLWVDTDAGAGSSYQVPTVAEMEAADAQVAAEIGSQIADSGWKNLTLTSAFTVYATSSVAQYRKIGNLVMLRGQIKPTSEIAASTTNTIMSTLPTGFRPGLALTFVCQGSGVDRWALTTYANGDLGVARYGAAALAAIPANTWLSFNIMFFVG